MSCDMPIDDLPILFIFLSISVHKAFLLSKFDIFRHVNLNQFYYFLFSCRQKLLHTMQHNHLCPNNIDKSCIEGKKDCKLLS